MRRVPGQGALVNTTSSLGLFHLLSVEMKAITCPVIIGSVSTRADNSVGIRLSTPELKPEEKTAFFELQGHQLKMLLQPDSMAEVELKEVKGQFDQKTPGQRLRACLFILWKQSGEQGDYDDFYRRNMEKLIEYVKSKLQPQT